MKLFQDELEKIKRFLNSEEVKDNKDYISLYTLNQIIETHLSFFNKYTDEYKKNFINNFHKDIQEYRGKIFSKNRKFMKHLKITQLSLEIDRMFNENMTSKISLLFKNLKYSHVFNGAISIKKNKEIDDIIIDIFDHNKEITEKEKNDIIRFVSNKYYNLILEILFDIEKLVELEMTLPQSELELLPKTIYLYDRTIIASQKIKKDFINIKLDTNALGYNKINIQFSENNINEVFNNSLLKPVELIDILNNNRELFLKRVKININELNEFYKKIVLESEYYRNLNNIKKLEKKID